MMTIEFEGPLLGQSSVCIPILRALPAWFGLEAGFQNYERQIDLLPTFLAREGGDVQGFLSVRQHTPYSAEIYVMGVRQENHRQGIGKMLIEKAEAYARSQGVEYMQVKTLGPSHPDQAYAKTRAFYEALGFRPLEEFKQIWDEANPCLILVKKI